MLARVALSEDLERIAAAAAEHAAPDEAVTGVIATEPALGRRVYVCSYEGPLGRSWLVLDDDARAVESRNTVREAVSIAAMCEIAEESAGGADLPELRAQLVQLRLTEAPLGIEEAEEAALELERTLGVPPRLASPMYLDRIGGAARRLERALGEGESPFVRAMQAALPVVEELAADVERSYKLELR
jgi:hypothetical protein